jgi:hypothetical protein
MSLSELGVQFGTDKGTLHSYLDTYEQLLGPLANTPVNILEISNNDWRKRASQLWLAFFAQGTLTSVAENLVPDETPTPRLTQLSWGPKDDTTALQAIPDGSLDVVIDDGTHGTDAVNTALAILMPKLKVGGYYFVEDLQARDVVEAFKAMPGWTVLEFYKEGRYDDVLAYIQKA